MVMSGPLTICPASGTHGIILQLAMMGFEACKMPSHSLTCTVTDHPILETAQLMVIFGFFLRHLAQTVDASASR